MRINVAQLLKGPVGAVRRYEVGEPLDVCDDGIERPVSGEVSLMRTGRGILVRGTLRSDIDVQCSRCLTVFHSPLVLNIEEEYFPTIDVLTGESLSPPEDEPASFTIDQHHELDLTEAVRQYAIMATPMKPLCRQDCAGLCTECGRNLNMGQCGCSAERVDPRWLHLLEKVNQKKGTE